MANNINSQETVANIRTVQIDCTAFKVSLVQICHDWQQSLIHIVFTRLERDLHFMSTFIHDNTNKSESIDRESALTESACSFVRINVRPAVYADIPVYQDMIDQLREEVPRTEGKLPLIDEQVALLIRYEKELDMPVSVASLQFYSGLLILAR